MSSQAGLTGRGDRSISGLYSRYQKVFAQEVAVVVMHVSWNSAFVFRTLWRLATGVFVGLTAMWLFFHGIGAKAAPAASTNGLTGFYYVSDLPLDEFQIPLGSEKPATTRVDRQIAFGQGKGFHNPKPERSADWAVQAGLTAGRVGWLKAVIWRGFIHLPKAGTYYFATASDGASAVYLNQARVALNGMGSHYGVLLNSDSLAYDAVDVQDFIQNVKGSTFATRRQDTYIVPVTVGSPRDLPIEVRYNAIRSEQTAGIDLLWVTPDSPRNADGKPIAKLVPADVLFTEAPGSIEQPVVRSANSTISSNLYCSAVNESTPLTLTFKLADKNGHPIAGKRVFFTTLADNDFGFDEVTDADKPTDQNGITTAQLKSKPDARAHTSAIYATDVTDLVDVGQVAHVRFPDVNSGFFASPCTAGFDPNLITVEPLPMMVGRPLTLKVKLENRQKSSVDLTATFQATDWNIGSNTWRDIGHLDNISLKPGETRDVSITWTPTATEVHQCFRVQLTKRNLSTEKQAGSKVLVATVTMPGNLLPILQANSGDASSGGSVQRNVGPVGDCGFDPTSGLTAGADDKTEVKEIMSLEAVGGEFGPPDYYIPKNLGQCKPNMAQKMFCKTVASNAQKFSASSCARALSDKDPGQIDSDGSFCRQETQNFGAAMKCYLDPADMRYRGIAVAPSDTVAGYIQGLTRSMERYQGAQDAGDQEWMARQNTAIALYQKRITEMLRRESDDLQKQAQQVPVEDSVILTAQKATLNALLDRLHHSNRFTDDERGVLLKAGFSDQQIKSLAEFLVQQKEAPSLIGQRDFAVERASAANQMAQDAERLKSASDDMGSGTSHRYVQSFDLSNPHDRTEDVHLMVEPLSVPTAWKLSVASAEQAETPAQAGGSAPPGTPTPRPEFPVQEVTPGREYVVSLPAKKKIKVASVALTMGEVGANTTARWAVEGRIGGEVIGTMVHEINVPYIVTDLKLPAVGSKEVMEEGAPLTGGQSRSKLIIAIGTAAVAVIAILLVFVWRRKQHASAA